MNRAPARRGRRRGERGGPWPSEGRGTRKKGSTRLDLFADNHYDERIVREP